MQAKQFNKFVALMDIKPPTLKQAVYAEASTQNWALLHPVLAKLEANDAGLETCRRLMHVELLREGGPRFHIMDRLYKRFSNLRREIETSAMLELLPEECEAVE